MRAAVQEKRVWLVIRGGCLTRVKAVADEFLTFDAAVDDTIGEVDEVGSEGESPGACDGCRREG